VTINAAIFQTLMRTLKKSRSKIGINKGPVAKQTNT